MIESFHLDKNYCMVFERLGVSLYDFLKFNNFIGNLFLFKDIQLNMSNHFLSKFWNSYNSYILKV